MLVVPRVAARAALGAALAAIISAAAPSATAAPSAATARQARVVAAAGSGIPAGAGRQLIAELGSAWQITRGAGAIVAVLDTGVANVSGLAGKIIKGPDYAPVSNPVFLDGTVIASLIAGGGPSSRNPVGTVGRAPAAKILSERIAAYGSSTKAALQYQAEGTWQAIEAKAIRYAVDHGAKIIVCDESGFGDYPALASSVAYAISRDVVVVTPGYPVVKNGEQYPDGLPGVISVTGTPVPGLPGPLRNGHFLHQYSVLLAAPSNDLFGTGPGNVTYIGYGNDAAIAWAAGTIALIKSIYPDISPALVARALAVSTNYHPSGGYNTTIGFGLINPIGALRAAAQVRALRLVAAAGPAVASPAEHFGHGSVPGVIDAVPLSPATLAASSAAVLVGLVALAFAFVMIRRARRGNPRLAAAGASPEPTSARADATDAGQPVRNENGLAVPPPDQPADNFEPPM